MTARFEVLRAVAVPMAIDNIDTDQIFPSRFVSKDRREGKYGDYFLHDRRFSEGEQPNQEFVLNDRRYHGAKIIVASKNYACGSARPGAIYSHLDYGIDAIIAESFGPVFPTVAYKSGLLTIQVGEETAQNIRTALFETPGLSIEIDLGKQIIEVADGLRFSFDFDPFIKKMFMEGISEISYTLGHSSKIEAFESTLAGTVPWLYGQRR